MADRNTFKRARNFALTEREHGRDELYRQVISTPIDSRWKIDPSIYSRLSPDQLRRVLSDATGDVAFASASTSGSAVSASTEQINVGTYREPGTLRRFWRRQRVGLRAAVVGVGLAIVAVALTGLREQISGLVTSPAAVPHDANRWPLCPRLNMAADACVYVVQAHLTWPQASQMLGIPLETLLQLNNHLQNLESLGRGSVLMVWRNKLPLENR